MPYTHIPWSELQARLSARLGDTLQVFWGAEEIQLYLKEALRTFGLATGFWRERGVFTTGQDLAFYPLQLLLPAALGLSIFEMDLVRILEYHLLERTAVGLRPTEMFASTDYTQALAHRRDQFLADTGVFLNTSVIDVPSPRIDRVPLSDTVIDVRRATWIGAAPFHQYYSALWRDDERLWTAYQPEWSLQAGTPESYSILASPPLTLALNPPPLASGQIELVTVNAGPNQPVVPVGVVPVPDDLTPAIRWGALADLLAKDGPARDPARSVYAEAQYQQYVRLARVLPVVVHAEIGGVPLIPTTLQELETARPNWQNVRGKPTDIAIAGANLIALSPVPNSQYAITLDVVRRAPVPVLPTDSVQVGREQIDMLIDYAEHLALLKVSGAEWLATVPEAQNFMAQCLAYNQRLSASARAVVAASEQSSRETHARPRKLETTTRGLGALVGGGGGR